MRHGLSLRARLFVAIVLVAVAVLAAASVATYVLVKRSIEENALQDMRERSSTLAELGTELQRAVPLTPEDNPRLSPQARQRRIAARDRARAALNLSGFNVVFIGPDGELATGEALPNVADVVGLPPGLAADDLDTAALVAGDEVSGTKGDTVYLAQAIGESRAFTTVVVATDTIDTSVLTDAEPWLLAAAIALLGLAAGAAWLVARRLTRPIRDIERTAQSLAAGDLSARAEVKPGTDPDLAALAATLNEMAAQLEAARGSERAFLLSVSHDLRTPLTSIRGYAEALGDGTIDGSDPEARERAAAVITAEARRL
ncbi:MAG TPA: HAMP domain-containing protein, partial [Acidimicrobiia bacterium]|nr:HAMP domain-containing protein [Acidimicrobiia bacterium]